MYKITHRHPYHHSTLTRLAQRACQSSLVDWQLTPCLHPQQMLVSSRSKPCLQHHWWHRSEQNSSASFFKITQISMFDNPRICTNCRASELIRQLGFLTQTQNCYAHRLTRGKPAFGFGASSSKSPPAWQVQVINIYIYIYLYTYVVDGMHAIHFLVHVIMLDGMLRSSMFTCPNRSAQREAASNQQSKAILKQQAQSLNIVKQTSRQPMHFNMPTQQNGHLQATQTYSQSSKSQNPPSSPHVITARSLALPSGFAKAAWSTGN